MILARTVTVITILVGFGIELSPTGEAMGQAPGCRLPEVREELARRVERDQQLRKRLVAQMNISQGSEEESPSNSPQIDISVVAELQMVDEENTNWIKQQIEQHGWLGRTLVGVEGAHHAWLLVQHADSQPDFQQHCLDLMTDMPEGEVSGADVAYLTDRVLIAAGKPQRYGTQVELVTGRAVIRNVEDKKNLDERRAELGLQPIAEYLSSIEAHYRQ